jgi:hypothetical protein
MTQKTANSCSTVDRFAVTPKNDPSRCQHLFVNGTRCRLLVPHADSLFCPRHARLPEHEHELADLSASLIADLTDFKSALPINEFLSRLLHHQAEDRITPRRAAVMAYTCNLLLRTLPAIEHELNPQSDEPQQIIWDLPRPHRDDPETSDTLALIRNISSANCNQGEDAPGKKLS